MILNIEYAKIICGEKSMKGKVTISSIILIIIIIIIAYAALKIFVWKKPIGIAAIDKLFTKESAHAIVGRWQKNNDPNYRISFNSEGQWHSSYGAGTYSFINSKCVELNNTSTSTSSITTYLYIHSISPNDFYASVCPSCINCDTAAEKYVKMQYEEKKILKDFAPDSAL